MIIPGMLLFSFTVFSGEILSVGNDLYSELSSNFVKSVHFQDEKSSIIEVADEDVVKISALAHEKFHRCGGFFYVADHEKFINEQPNPPVFENYSITEQERVKELNSLVEESEIRSTIEKLTTFHNRYYRSKTGIAAAKWIHDRWKELVRSRNDVELKLFKHKNFPQSSVVLIFKGQERPDEYIGVGGHLDSIAGYWGNERNRAPGADDDASGIAVLTEMIRVMVKGQYKANRSVVFMAYAAEEVGLRGSQEVAASFQGKDVRGVLQLDMTNFNGSDWDVVLITDNTHNQQNVFLGKLIDEYVKLNWGHSKCGYACSDHASWNRRGVPVSFPFESKFNEYNRSIHTKNDTLERSSGNASHSVKFAHLGMSYVLEMAK